MDLMLGNDICPHCLARHPLNFDCQSTRPKLMPTDKPTPSREPYDRDAIADVIQSMRSDLHGSYEIADAIIAVLPTTALHPISAGEGKGDVAKIGQIEMRHTFDEIASWKGGPAWAEKCHEDRGWLLEQLSKKPEPIASVPVTRAALGRLHDAIRDGALKFREYQNLHQAKNPPDLRKANANAWMANYMEKALEEAAAILASSAPPAAQGAEGMGEIDQEQLAKWLFKHFGGSNNDWSPTSCGTGLQVHWRNHAGKLVAFIYRQQGNGG